MRPFTGGMRMFRGPLGDGVMTWVFWFCLSRLMRQTMWRLPYDGYVERPYSRGPANPVPFNLRILPIFFGAK